MLEPINRHGPSAQVTVTSPSSGGRSTLSTLSASTQKEHRGENAVALVVKRPDTGPHSLGRQSVLDDRVAVDSGHDACAARIPRLASRRARGALLDDSGSCDTPDPAERRGGRHTFHGVALESRMVFNGRVN
jgi:hypothetical protein